MTLGASSGFCELRGVADSDVGPPDRYPKAQVRDFDGNPAMVSEMDALVAYLQMLGTLVDFNTYAPGGLNAR